VPNVHNSISMLACFSCFLTQRVKILCGASSSSLSGEKKKKKKIFFEILCVHYSFHLTNRGLKWILSEMRWYLRNRCVKAWITVERSFYISASKRNFCMRALASSSVVDQRVKMQINGLKQQNTIRFLSAAPKNTSPSHDSNPGVSLSSIVVSKLPLSWQPYLYLARLDKPIGTMLLLWPCLWGVALGSSSGSFPDPLLCSQFALGALIMRSAGCTINDMWDRDFDKHVSRTSTRPLASGILTMKQAGIFLVAELLAGFGVLVSLDYSCFWLAMASMPLVVLYPAMKRFTNWPQFVLGMTFNWGALVGYTAVTHVTEWSYVLPLYTAGVFWTLVYDTIYAYQDVPDDKKLGKL
jgi:4-hydroxybenzoate polyprenyltransferase